LYLIDTNIFLEVELGEEHAAACERLLKKVKDAGLSAYVTDFTVDSVALVMENYGRSWRDLRRFFAGLLLYKGLRIHYLSLPDRVAAATIMKQHGLDFDDALAYQGMKSHGIKEIISYDEHFDKVSVIKRFTPQELL